MEQKSDVEFRAEKIYKSLKERFGYLLREVVSNAIHATIIRLRKNPGSGYKPEIRLEIVLEDKSVSITVIDNGEGFTEQNRRCFTHLDYKNAEKMELNLFPQGQGRLSIVFFADSATYTSTFRDDSGTLMDTSFPYPKTGNSLFDIEDGTGDPSSANESGTTLRLNINKQQTLGRAKTFFEKYDSKDKLYGWVVDNFFPFFMEFDTLSLDVSYLSESFVVSKATIESTVSSVPFDVKSLSSGEDRGFRVWIVGTDSNTRRSGVFCYARHLEAELARGKLVYEIDLPSSAHWILTSDYFDNYVDSKGDRIEISPEDVEKIQFMLNLTLDQHYKTQIESNRKETKANVEKAVKRFHSLKEFIEPEEQNSKKVLREAEIVGTAIDKKGKVEKAYWTSQDTESDDVQKLINSSLHIYVAHRNRVLDKFHGMILRFDDNGDYKSEPEDDIHDLFLKRGAVLSTEEDVNHLHNLWVLDDKYTVFSETKKVLSSKRGQELSDIYLWIDDPEKVKELLILELKSTTSAHNSGDKYESMVAQVKRYAAQFYREPNKVLAWDIDPSRVLFSGIILARKSDINKELNSNNTSGNAHKIPFLESSFFYNERFSVTADEHSPPVYKEIRIELLSFEDVYELSRSRNKVFFKLLNGEYSVVTGT